MKQYVVYYIRKQHRQEHLRHITIEAPTAKAAVKECRQIAWNNGYNAFRATTKKPHEVFTVHGTKVLTI